MRTVSAELGVSPEPLYKRIGNKDALLDAMARRLLVDVAPRVAGGRVAGRNTRCDGRPHCMTD